MPGLSGIPTDAMSKNYTVSNLARLFGLSRSTLLYYDRIGLLRPSGRSLSGYRYYDGKGVDRLTRICTFREAGLSLSEIRLILEAKETETEAVIEHRLREVGKEIRDLRIKQDLLCAMLRNVAGTGPQPVDKQMWVQMLRAAGMDEEGMADWHAEFERRAPESHEEFLASLGIAEDEIRRIREWSARRRTQAQGEARDAEGGKGTQGKAE